jgi:hypothetical protein
MANERLKYLWSISRAAADYEDGETGIAECIRLYCQDKGIDDETCEAAVEEAFIQGALSAGIPYAVIMGERKLKEYSQFQEPEDKRFLSDDPMERYAARKEVKG